MKKLKHLPLLGLAAALTATPAFADLNTERLIDSLIEKGIISTDEAAEIRHRPPVVDRHPGLNYEPTTRVEGDEIRTRVNQYRVETADGAHRFGVRGRLMVDHAQLQNPWETTDDDRLDRGDLGSRGTIIRRARIGVLGLMHDRWEWQLEIDFRDEEVRFANAYMAYLFDSGRLAVGNFKEPFSMESSTSSRRISFIERATPVDAYRPSRNPGILYETLRPNWYGAFGIFGDGIDRDRDATKGWSAAGRLSFAPVLDQSNGIWSHLGVSANHRVNRFEHERSRGDNREYSSVRMRSRLGTRAVDGRIIGRRDFENVEDYSTYVLEAAYGHGPFSIQAEYLQQELNRDINAEDFAGIEPTDGSGDPISDFSGSTDPRDFLKLSNGGYYVQTSYFLTGENRNYRAFSGDFGQTRILNPVSKGGAGAFEVLARYATADSTDHHDARGRQEVDHYTLGMNWYPEKDIVVKFNAMYIDAENEIRNTDGEIKDWTSMVYALRFQYEF